MRRGTTADKQRLPRIALMFPPSVSGIMGGIFLADITRMLAPLSSRIYVIAVFRPKNHDEENLCAIEMKGYADDESLLSKGVKFLLIEIRACLHLLRISKDVDLVFFHIGTGLYLLPLIVAKLLRKRTIFSETGLYSQRAAPRYRRELLGLGGLILPPVFRILESATFHLAERIIVESESVISASGLTRYRDKVSVVPMRVIDADSLRIEKALGERNLIGYIGRLGGEKGIANLARALPAIFERNGELRCLIGGDGPALDEIKRELERNGSNTRTTLAGWISHDEMGHYLNQLRLFILPSYVEGLPGTILEAMACGTPVLATPVGGIPDAVADGQTGFLLEDNSPECIARNVLRALDCPDLEGIAENARSYVEREQTLDAALRKYRDVFTTMKL